MLRISKRITDKNQCRGFSCLVKKRRQSVSRSSIGSSMESGTFYPDNMSEFEIHKPFCSSVSCSSASYIGANARRFSGDEKVKSSKASFSSTSYSGVHARRVSGDVKVEIPHWERDSESFDKSSPTASSNLTPLSGIESSQVISNMKSTTLNRERDFEFSNDNSYTDSSSLTPLSGVYTNRFNGDMKVRMPQQLTENANPRHFKRPQVIGQKLIKTSNAGRQKFKKFSDPLEVVSPGTRLMRRIEYPTVCIHAPRSKFRHSMVWYLILEPVSERYVGNIACLLFPSPYNTKYAQIAELLPIQTLRSRKHPGTFKLSPMLLRERYRCLFEEGCSFRVKAVKHGRRSDWKIRLSKNYDLEKPEIYDLLRRLICLDISRMPSHMLKLVTPLRVAEQKTKIRRRKQRKSYSSLLHKRRSRVMQNRNLIKLYPELLDFRRLDIGYDSKFTRCHNEGPSQMQLTKDFVFDRKTHVEWNEYSSISDTI